MTRLEMLHNQLVRILASSLTMDVKNKHIAKLEAWIALVENQSPNDQTLDLIKNRG